MCGDEFEAVARYHRECTDSFSFHVDLRQYP